MDAFVLVIGIVMLALLLLLTVCGLLAYSGFFHEVAFAEVPEAPLGACRVALKFRQGPYRQAGQLFAEAVRLADGARLPCVGFYYDDPHTVPADKCRYAVGLVLHNAAAALHDDTPSAAHVADVERRLVERGFRVAQLPAVGRCVHTQFPFKSILSVYIFVARAYGAASRYLTDRSLTAQPFIELYDRDLIHLILPLVEQERFFIKEVLEAGLQLDDALKTPIERSAVQLLSRTVHDYLMAKDDWPTGGESECRRGSSSSSSNSPPPTPGRREGGGRRGESTEETSSVGSFEMVDGGAEATELAHGGGDSNA